MKPGDRTFLYDFWTFSNCAWVIYYLYACEIFLELILIILWQIKKNTGKNLKISKNKLYNFKRNIILFFFGIFLNVYWYKYNFYAILLESISPKKILISLAQILVAGQ